MDKDIFKGLKIGIGIITVFSFFAIVSAGGYHLASEILPGTFSGEFTFNDNVTFSKNVLIGYERVEGSGCSAAAQNDCSDYVYCSAGKKIIGGGCTINTNSNYVNMRHSQPLATEDGWRCTLANEHDSSSYSIYSFAICANID